MTDLNFLTIWDFPILIFQVLVEQNTIPHPHIWWLVASGKWHLVERVSSVREIVEHSLKTLWVANTLGRRSGGIGTTAAESELTAKGGSRKWGIMIGASVLQFSIHSPSSMCLQYGRFTHTHLLRNCVIWDPPHVQLLLLPPLSPTFWRDFFLKAVSSFQCFYWSEFFERQPNRIKF